MRILLVGDCHLADRPPSLRTETYTEDILAKIEQAVHIANREGVSALVQAGDVFHLKAPSRNSHALVQRTGKLLQQANCPVLIVPGNHDLCLLDDHEALTDKGWRRLADLDGTERFATLSPETHDFQWQAPLRINRFTRTGPMLSFQSQSVDHVVTPNHDLYVNVGNKDKHLARGFSKRKAAEHPQYRGWRCWSTAPEWSGKSPETVVIGEHVLPAMEAAEFFGWYVSEGSVIEGVAPMRRVTISQSKERSPAEWARIEHLLTVLGLPYVARKDGKAFRINSKVLAEFMASEFGPRGREIRVPDWLMEWDKPELDRFLEAYFLGDGTSNESGKGVLEASCVVARTCSQALVDSMQALCARLGWTVTIGGWRDFPYGGTEYVGRALTYSFKRRQLVGLPVPEVVHVENREVWCPTLPNGVWLVRRNGKAIWTGNSADRLDSLPKQPLGTLARMTGIDLLIGPHPDLPLFGLPWLQTWNDLPVWMDRWRRWSDDLRAEWEWPLMVTHAPIFPRGEEPPYDYIDAENWADLMVNGDCYVGHIHDPHGVYQPLKHRAVMLCNHGAISRGSLHEKTLKREPAVTLWDSEKSGTQRFLRIPLNVRPVEAVFRLHEKEDADEKVSRVEAFLEQIGQTRLDGLALEEVRERARRSGLRTETVTLIEELLEAVS